MKLAIFGWAAMLLALVFAAWPARAAAPVCHPDAGELVKAVGGVFYDLIDDPDDESRQVLVIEVSQRLIFIVLHNGCSGRPLMDLTQWVRA